MKMTHPTAAWFWAAALSLALAACNLPSTPMPGAAIPATHLPTAVLPATPQPTAPPALTPASSSAPSGICLAPKAHTGLLPSPFNSLPGVIAAFLNSGATPDELGAALSAASLGNPPNPVLAGDLNGDGKLDVVAAVVDPTSSSRPPAGEMLVFTCAGGAYRLSYTLVSTQNSGAPAVQTVEDLNADGKAEIVAGQQTCGAHTCFTSVQVLAWSGNGFQNRLTGRTDDIPYPHVQINAVTEGGIAEIVIQGGMIDSVGAGPQRTETRTWAFDQASGNWLLASDALAPSNYRIHLVQDADATLRKGDVNQALVVYNWVLSDQPPLQDYQNPSSEKLTLGAYAAYKIAVIHLSRAETGAAQQMLDQMARSYPAGTPEYAFLEMALAYQSALTGGDASKACNAVTEYSLAHPSQVLDPLGPQVFGYSNKSFGAQDMCP